MENSISIIAFLILILLVCAGTYISFKWLKKCKKKAINKPMAAITIIATALVLIFTFFAMMAGTLFITISEDPRETVMSFYDAVMAKDYEKALSLHKNTKSFAIQSSTSSEEAVAIKKALEDSYSFAIINEPVRKKLNANVQVAFTHLDLDKLEKYITDNFESVLTDKIKKTSKSKIYDANNNYKQEFLDTVYQADLSNALANTADFMVTEECDVALHYGDGKWTVTSVDSVLSTNVETYATNAKINQLNNYLADNQVIIKSYKIEGDNVPAPNPANYGTATAGEVNKVLEVIEKAKESGLMDGQEVSFKAGAQFYGDITYYYDETILAISWKEWIEGHVCAFSEIKVADASQFRRKLADDTYGSSKQYYLTAMTKQTNAIVAANADFYAFRNLGTTVYNGEVKRVDGTLDGLYIDSDGNFNFLDKNNGYTKEQLQAYVDQHNIQFALAFGPIIIRDGQQVPCSGYPIGEVLRIFSRAGIGQIDELHYLYMHVGHYDGASCLNINDFSRIMLSKGVKQGYNLDGGQTGELIMNNTIINHIDYGNERPVSDMIYFCTALAQ